MRFALIAVLLVGCSHKRALSPTEYHARYMECLREHGVPPTIDPDSKYMEQYMLCKEVAK